jgi:hypothetical protein
MAHRTPQRALFEESFQKAVVVQFDGEQSSSDGGGVLLCAVDRRIGLTRVLSQELRDDRRASRVEHTKQELFSQRVFAIALGYADQNDSARVAGDPLLKLLCGRSPSDPG